MGSDEDTLVPPHNNEPGSGSGSGSDRADPPELESSDDAEPQSDNTFRHIPKATMAADLDVGIMHIIKPARFGGGGDTHNIVNVLNTLDLTFPCLDRQIVNQAKRERVRVLALQSLLDGPA